MSTRGDSLNVGATTGLPMQPLVHGLRLLVEVATTLFFVSFVIIISAQVFWRYALNDSLFWAEEFVRFALFWMTMLSIALAADRKAHIVMDLLYVSVGSRVRHWLDIANSGLSVLFLALLGYYGIQLIRLSWDTMSPVMDLAMSWVYLAVPVGCLATIIFTLDALVRGAEASDISP